MVIPSHSQTTQENSEDYEEVEHCPDGSLMYLHEMEPAAFRVCNEVLGPLLVGYFLNVLAYGGLAQNPEVVACSPRWGLLGRAKIGERPFDSTLESQKSCSKERM